MAADEFQELSLRASQAFSPAAPIREKDVFAGRRNQITAVVDAINQKGQHVMIYGERGVGKTSLANVIDAFVLSPGQGIIAPHINCDATDTFTSIWRKLLDAVSVVQRTRKIGFDAQEQAQITRFSDTLPETITPREILLIAHELTLTSLFVPIIDEFDRLQDDQATRLLADTIKALSDQNADTTVILVGVADTVDELIREHQSIERALVQIRMPRMARPELLEILDNGAKILGMQIDSEARDYIAALSLGLPHYTHLLGLHACRSALQNLTREVQLPHVEGAIRAAIKGAQQQLQRAYHSATMSSRKESLYEEVLLACALADTDELGYFAAADVRAPMTRIMSKPYDIPQFSQHLQAFCEESRGPILERTGSPRRYRFRFRMPLLQPYVIMLGLVNDRIEREDVVALQERRASRKELDLS